MRKRGGGGEREGEGEGKGEMKRERERGIPVQTHLEGACSPAPAVLRAPI